MPILIIFPSPSPLDILPNILNITGKMILLPLSLTVLYFPTATIFPSPLQNLIFLPNRLNKLISNFIHPCACLETAVFDVAAAFLGDFFGDLAAGILLLFLSSSFIAGVGLENCPASS